MAVIAAPLTLEAFLQLPEEEPPLEYIDGVVTQNVSPQGQHSSLQLVLAWRLDEAGEHGKVAKAFPELRTTFAGASRVPDIAVYRRDRLPLDANGKIANVFTVPPDIAIEIVSPEQRFNAVMRRCLWYVTHGVQVALLVDPDDESVLAFRPDGLPVAWMGADRIDVSEVIPDFDLTAEQLFAALYPAS